MTDAAAIAAKLTKAQRSAVRDAYRPCPFDDSVMSRLVANGTWCTTNVLFDLGLTDHNEALTETGLAVRAILQEQPNDHNL